MSALFSPLKLANGSSLPNRICKAAMEENMAEGRQVPGNALCQLYARWASGNPGLILSGNVMVDPLALTGAGGIVLEEGTLDDPAKRAAFERWAECGTSGTGQFWMQISHPGRQVFATQGTPPVSASATKVNMPGMEKLFDQARALTTIEIKDIIKRFADTAQAAKSCGFDGVEVHAAHGYLVAQFLSPLTNLRDDEWGGSLENRARFLLEIIRAVRKRVGPDFGVGIKLNSADFQRGGFDIEDSQQVVKWLNAESVDLVEISGGSYESAAMMGQSDDGRVSSTAQREMYFIEFAQDIAKTADMPLMVTGGVTKLSTANEAIESDGVDIIGIARAMAFNPYIPIHWKSGKNTEVFVQSVNWKNKALAGLAGMSMTKTQLHRIGAGKPPKKKVNAIGSVIRDRMRVSSQTKRYKKWLESGRP